MQKQIICNKIHLAHPSLPPGISVQVVHLNTINIGVNLFISTNGIEVILLCHNGEVASKLQHVGQSLPAVLYRVVTWMWTTKNEQAI